ncbi:carbohydrate kinase family protein [Nocardia panacis]|uniref:Carbohydrate kinase family protein n=1 Tax=Nocardia panacis TaxID=2340916 RepID=A0A3A4K8T0_9NOCA|nr:carbohydrate kinase family protein [Nocardia panacis]RJO74109.1 carbohydrate kinase family protein [Nocardia panacis]
MLPQDPGTIAIRNILTRLCKRSGLSLDRLRTTEIDVAALLDLPAVRRHATRAGIDPAAAVLPVVVELARRLAPTNRLIADAELTLGLLRENTCTGIDFDRLYAADLGERRRYLTEQWEPLHRAIAAEHIPPAPTVRSLRASPERRAFTALAGLLTGENFAPAQTEAQTAPVRSLLGRGAVTVIGDAVIDHIYVVDRLPRAGEAVQGNKFEEHPGGKGLARAIAAARLGLQVRLVSAVGRDDLGERILDHLRREGVDTSLVRAVPDAPTPVTALMITGTGAAARIGWSDERIRTNRPDRAARDAIAASDVVILTFGQPVDVLAEVMDIVRKLPSPPILVVHPAPRLEQPQYLIPYFGAVDYLIGTPAELADVIPAEIGARGNHSRDLDADIAPRLRALGVAGVCALDGFACSVRSADLTADITRSPAAMLEDAPGAQAAFVAALAYRLVTTGRTADRRDFEWATAAMAAAQSFGDIPTAMPAIEEIDRIANLAPRRAAEGRSVGNPRENRTAPG